MKSLLTGHLKSVDHMMRSMMMKSTEKEAADALCLGCPYHRPKWKYRFCRFVECPCMKGFFTFKE